jgi:ABC-type glycerol-3-phosphate transport system permease component
VVGEPARDGQPFWTRRRITDLSCGSILAILALIGLFPYLIALVVSFKDDMEYAQSAWLPTLPLQFENWSNAWNQINIYWVNSFIVAGAVTVALLALSSVAGFVFARYKFPGNSLLFFLIIIMIAVPSVINLVPLFLLVRNLHMIDTLWALILPYTVGGLYASVYLLRNSIRAINDELFEAARIDGSSGPQMYWFVVLPLSRPIMGTVIMTQLTGVWNEYIWAFLVINDANKRTIGTGLQFFTNEQTTSFGPLFAGYILASVPLLIAFIFLSRYFVAGIQAGTGK